MSSEQRERGHTEDSAQMWCAFAACQLLVTHDKGLEWGLEPTPKWPEECYALLVPAAFSKPDIRLPGRWCADWISDCRLQLGVPEAVDQMVIHHSDCLHEGITDRAADEPEASFL